MTKEKIQGEKVLDKLQQISERSELKLHLASMELRTTWEKVEYQLEKMRNNLRHFVGSVEQKNDEARLRSHLALMEAQERWNVLKEHVGDVTDNLAQKSKPAIDHARVQAHLAKMEAEDLPKKLEAQSERAQKLGEEIKEDWYRFLTHIDDNMTNIINKFPLR